MKVALDFEKRYQTEQDSGNIGEATSKRYQRYYELIVPHAHGALLDIGCGQGAFLARFYGMAASLDGVELSPSAIAKGRECFPYISFHEGSAASLDALAALNEKRFDLIICSDVIHYLDDRTKSTLLAWISAHLNPKGVAFIAAWCPGGTYLAPHELEDLVKAQAIISYREAFPESEHLALLATRRRKFVAITVNYETGYPIPSDKSINWKADILDPTERLLQLFEASGVQGTFFAELGEYFWLKANDQPIALQMEAQWRDIVTRGHEVQLLLHLYWMPELGASHKDGTWFRDWKKAKIAEYPGDLTEFIAKCKTALEEAIRPICPTYQVTTFRAGAYQAQPFERLSQALAANGLLADTSVNAGGASGERGYDNTQAYHWHQPYFANPLNPQLMAIPTERQLVEFPVFTPEPGRRWLINSNEGRTFARRLLRHEQRMLPRTPLRIRRLLNRLMRLAGKAYDLANSNRLLINRLLPRTIAHSLKGTPTSLRHGNHYYVAIGHTKADLDHEALKANFTTLRETLGVEFVTLPAMVQEAHTELIAESRKADHEIRFQVQRESQAILNQEHNLPHPSYLQQLIPLDVHRVLDFGCGTGDCSESIAKLYPWTQVTGVDAEAELISKAKQEYESSRVRFLQVDFANLPLGSGSVDCVYADNTLECSFHVDAALTEIHRVLRDGGALVAAIRLDGLNPHFDCDSHTWKPTLAEVILRLERAGFSNLHIEPVDTYRKLGMAPYAPSNDLMLYLRAWKGAEPDTPTQRARRAMAWIYAHILPTQSNLALDPKKLIADGYAYCMGYTIALGGLLKREGYAVTWVTMEAEDHPRGSGPRQRDTHEVLEVELEGRRCVLDPTANTFFPHSLQELLKTPSLADRHANRDERCTMRGYDLYNTAFWYERVTRYTTRHNPRHRIYYWKRPQR